MSEPKRAPSPPGTAATKQDSELASRPPATSSRSPARQPRRRGPFWRSAALLLLMFAAVGTAPLAVAARSFNLWTLPTLPDLTSRLPGLSALVSTPTPPDLALPRSAWIAAPVTVSATPGQGAIVASLQPGFPVLLTSHRQVGNTVWDHVRWNGPTANTGGQGWMRDALLTSVAGSGPAVGDAAALSPALAAALNVSGPGAALAVYYPDASQLYLASADRPCPLGPGARALLLAALLARSTSSDRPSADTEHRIATGDPIAAGQAYTHIGNGAGLADVLAQLGVAAGVLPGDTDWTHIQATPRALVQFYAMLAGARSAPIPIALDSAARAQVLDLVGSDPAARAIAALDPSAAGAHVALVLGAVQQPDGWVLNAAGVLTAPSGLTYVAAACVRGQRDPATGEQALHRIFTQLATIAAG